MHAVPLLCQFRLRPLGYLIALLTTNPSYFSSFLFFSLLLLICKYVFWFHDKDPPRELVVCESIYGRQMWSQEIPQVDAEERKTKQSKNKTQLVEK